MDAAAAHWWTSIAQRRLLLQRCGDCDVVQHPPGPWCRSCRSAAAVEWVPHAGTGRLLSFTQVLRTTYPELQSELPYWIALVELSPGAVLVANLIEPADGFAEKGPSVGDAVQLTYRERGGVTLPMFELVDKSEAR